MWKKLSRHKLFLSIGAGLATVLAFPPIEIIPMLPVAGLLLAGLCHACTGFKDGFRYGFLTGLVIMLGGFYWVVYVIHEFGNLPWSVAALMYLGFCGFGTINFPLFTGLAASAQKRLSGASPAARAAWITVGLPALFTSVEFLVPKLFPWYVGHSLYRQLWLVQIVELTGTTVLSFGVLSLGSVLWTILSRDEAFSAKARARLLAFPIVLIAFSIGFSLWRLAKYQSPEGGSTLRVALVQANIGSLDKVKARKGIQSQVRYTVDRYAQLTDQALAQSPRPDLVVWPETAMPFYLQGKADYAKEMRARVASWNVPIVTGGYAHFHSPIYQDYNAAFLFDPKLDLEEPQVYHKNILLAFGEYMPFGEMIPSLYRWFPAVSNFMHGTTQPIAILADGRRLGLTVCYEAIVPEFFRKITKQGVQIVFNLTNDSWFGPTSEPHQHAALSIFRAIESRVPLVRATNTGLSVAVDASGKMSPTIPVDKEGFLVHQLWLPEEPPRTLYVEWGDWFAFVCMLGCVAVLVWGKAHASLPLRLGRRGSSS